jgi:hypothetical protein
MGMHQVPLFVWSVLITAFLLLLSLPVFAGGPFKIIAPANQSGYMLGSYHGVAIISRKASPSGTGTGTENALLRDYTPEVVNGFRPKHNLNDLRNTTLICSYLDRR